MLSIRCRHRLSLIYFFLSFHPLCVYLSVLRFLATPCILPLRNDGIAQWIFSTRDSGRKLRFLLLYLFSLRNVSLLLFFERLSERSFRFNEERNWSFRYLYRAWNFRKLCDRFAVDWSISPGDRIQAFFLWKVYCNIWMKLNQSLRIGTWLYRMLVKRVDCCTTARWQQELLFF